MKRMSIIRMGLIGLLTIGLGVGDVFARTSSSRSSGGFSRSSTRSYRSSSKPTTKPKYTPSKAKASNTKATYKPSQKKTKTQRLKKTSGGFGKTKVDTTSASYKKTNAQIKKDFGTSNKKYKSMKEAKSDLGHKMANKTYSYKDATTAMSHRPSYVPASYGGYGTTYYNGHYGYYGAGHVWVPYLATHMIINDAQMYSYAPNAYNEHVYARSNTGLIMSLSFTLIIGILIVGTIYWN